MKRLVVDPIRTGFSTIVSIYVQNRPLDEVLFNDHSAVCFGDLVAFNVNLKSEIQFQTKKTHTQNYFKVND